MANSHERELSVGDRIGRYEILSVLGSGAMGMVYKCRHDVLGRVVAIKTLRLQRTTDDRTQKRFIREAQMGYRLDHENLIGLVDFGNMANGDPYLVMEFVSGQSLYEIMKRERYLIPERAVSIFAQVCDGLSHAHQRGVIHRDLKPANILVIHNEGGPEKIKIVDLGVAKMVQGGEDDQAEAITMTGEVCGSPIYLSPEQCMYQELDARTDIYSLGVCLYECLTGVPPLRGATVYDTIYMHVHEMPRPFGQVGANPDIPKRLEEVVFRCLQKQPKDRFETMAQLKHELQAALKTQSEAINVLPPESLFGSGSGSHKAAAPGKKASGEQARPPEPRMPQAAPPQAPAQPNAQELQAPPQAQYQSGPLPSAHLDYQSGPQAQAQDAQLHSGQQAAAALPGQDIESEFTADSTNDSSKLKALSKGKGKTSKGKSKKSASGKPAAREKEDSSLLGGNLAQFSKFNVRNVGLLASMALVFFGFGSVFQYFIMKSMEKPAEQAQPANNTTPVSSPFVDPPKETTKSTADSHDKTSKSASNANKSSASKPGQKSSNTNKTVKTAIASKPASMDDLEAMLDGQGSQNRYQAIVEHVPNTPHQHSAGKYPPKQAPNRTYTHLKPGRHMPQARPMPTLRRTALSGGGPPMGGRQMPMMGNGQMPMMGNGQMPMMPMGNGRMPMMGNGQMPMMGNGQMPMMPPGGGAGGLKGGSLLSKIQDFVASQSGGMMQPSSSAQPNMGGGMPGQSSDVLGQQTALSNEATRLCQAGQWEAACQKFEMAYNLNRSNVEVKDLYAYALNSYAVKLNKQGNYEQAVQYVKKAVNLSPGNSLYQNNHHKFLDNLKNKQAGNI